MIPAHAKAQDITDMRMCQTLPDNLQDNAVFSEWMLSDAATGSCASTHQGKNGVGSHVIPY